MIGAEGQNLIFILSQPRTGSTMLQRMLAAHPAVHTAQEPWIMLDLADSLRRGGAADGLRGSELFVDAFLEILPGSREDYVVALRQAAGHLYNRALAGSGRTVFVDKSPPYFRIIPELRRIFPAARYIVLLRNPLAVLCSILSSWVGDHWFMLHSFQDDLLLAPRLLLSGQELLGSQACLVRYELLVRQPEQEIAGLCRWLGLPYSPAMVEYGQQGMPRWPWADQKNVYDHDRPLVEQAFRWHDQLREPQTWRLAHDYLETLGRPLLDGLGYDFDEQRALLAVHQPDHWRRWTFSLAWLAARPVDARRRWDWWRLRAGRSLQRRGVWGSLRYGLTGRK